MTVLLVALGGAAGSVLRFLVDTRAARRFGSKFPWGTLIVNVAASLLLGVITGAASAAPAVVPPLVGTGFAGALSTYSSFGYETVRLLQSGDRVPAVINLAGNVAATLAAAGLGLWLGGTVGG